tara:strand:+ start:3007 stop:4773 length:1767 start_codon:yes stop_codon:yes gene_type:complete
MKILKLLNKFLFLIISFAFITINTNAEDKPVDIWNIDNSQSEQEIGNQTLSIEEQIKINPKASIFDLQSQSSLEKITLEENLISKEIKIVGLFDPKDYGLDINMWSYSDGDQIKNILTKINKINLSEDSNELMKITLFTNAYYPEKNITEKEIFKFKSDWLIKYSNLEFIEEYLIKNKIVNNNSELTRYLVDKYLSNGNLKKACEIFDKISEPIVDNYLSKFNIYCLIKNNKKDEAQIIFDLKKELGFKDKYFETKINYLLGYDIKIDEKISEESVLDFHLAHQTNQKFEFNPKDSTDKIIWKYLSSFNLLQSFQETDVSELEKISNIELAVHNKNYPEQDLFNIYKRFQFNINQLINAQDSYKSLSNIEARALIYQRILLESEIVERLKLLKILKNLFKKDNLQNAFDIELKNFLEKIDPLEIPDNLTSFYYTNIKIEKKLDKKIKFNNDVLHQSKLINYFNGDFSKSKIEKDLNNFLKKIKKNKKYFLSKKDIILIDSLKADGILIEKKYDDLYSINPSEIPTDIQVMINNNEKGAALLRIIEVIGEDSLERMDEDTIYFIIKALNQLDIDWIRNKILLKVLPLKV